MYASGPAHGNFGRVARTNAFAVMFRVMVLVDIEILVLGTQKFLRICFTPIAALVPTEQQSIIAGVHAWCFARNAFVFRALVHVVVHWEWLHFPFFSKSVSVWVG